MRDVAVVLFFIAASVAAFKRPLYGALLWVLFGLMNPHRMTWGFAYSLPFAQLAAIVTVLATLRHRDQVRWPRGVPMVLLIIFIAWMGVTTLTAIVPAPSMNKYIDVLKVLGMAIFVAALIRTREEIVSLVWVMVLSIGFFGFKGGLFTIATGGSHRVWGPPSSLVEGNNELAVALIMTIPLLYFLATNVQVARDFVLVPKVPDWVIRWGGYLGMVLCAASALGSQSRGALLAIMAMVTMLWWRSKSKLTIGIALVLAVVVAIPMLPDSWFERMETIGTYQDDLSALQRINAWETAVNIARDRPTGAGFATANEPVFSRYSPRGAGEWMYVAHSIYFQVLGDHGWVGLAMYLTFWVTTYFGAGRVARKARPHPELAWAVNLMNMCKVSMVGFAAGGAFLSLAYWDMPYYLMVIVVVTGMLVRATDQRPLVAESPFVGQRLPGPAQTAGKGA